mmetsp:Transcript_9037/g.13432  ORF Transcript_9037/g.13432 Transcript_9037/m.13432 type:complete len:413 (-) Transcript_9037:260-1498(-)
MAPSAMAMMKSTELRPSTFNFGRRITALSALFLFHGVQARTSSLNLAKSIVNDPKYFSHRHRRAAEIPTFLVQHRRFGVLRNNPDENIDVKRTTQSSSSTSVQACDAAFIDCIPHEKCITCYSTMETEEIDWTNIVPETPCVDVVDYLADAGYCKDLKYDAGEMDVFCNTFNSCIVWDDDDEEEEEDDDDTKNNDKIQKMISKYIGEEDDEEIIAVLKGGVDNAKKSSGGGGGGGGEKYERLPPEERAFSIFANRMKRAPYQVVRYAYGGLPLWSIPTPSSPEKIKSKSKQCTTTTTPTFPNVPKCICGSERLFEFQIMPSILHVLNVDDYNKDDSDGGTNFGVVAVYSCANSCDASQEEFVLVQDSADGEPKKHMIDTNGADVTDAAVAATAKDDDDDDDVVADVGKDECS